MLDTTFILSRLNFYSLIDILLVAFIFYWLLKLIQGTQAVQLLRGILILFVLAVISVSFFKSLTAFSWLLDKVLPSLLVAIPIIFQPELRRALDRLGSTGNIFASAQHYNEIEKSIQAVTTAAVVMSNSRHGALIVFERTTALGDHIETGVPLQAVTTSELLLTIFFPNTTLHDGGVVIRRNQVVAASVVFPVGNNVAVSKQMLGTRHRAALGISQLTDAIAVVVSEETGTISLAVDGELVRGLDGESLAHLLCHFYQSQFQASFPTWQSTRQQILKRLHLKKESSNAIRET